MTWIKEHRGWAIGIAVLLVLVFVVPALGYLG